MGRTHCGKFTYNRFECYIKQVILLFLYLLFSLLTFLQLRLAYKFEKKYRFPYLAYYRTYLIFFLAYGFIKYVGYIFMLEFFSDRMDENILATQLALLIFPFFAVALYSMLLWVRNLTEKTVPMLVKIIYWAVQCFLFAYMVFHRIVNLNDQNAAPDRLWSFIHNAEAIILFVIIIQLFFLAREIKIQIKKQFIKSLGLIYLISFAVFEAYQQLSLFFLEDYPLYYFSTVGGLYFCVNIPALFYFLRFMRSHHQEMVELPLSEDEMSQFCLDYSITPREKEIIGLISTGKSNQEIGECLHISIQTVKNINSNIYKKIDIKNRLQLLNRIQAFRNTDKG